MRILSISGQNIASLAEPFRIDLAAPPLGGAGLFAITGETGAGKSSLLDALCLALYGDCPRLDSGARSESVPDGGGEPIGAHDPRAVLRRGAAQGWAEVAFTGIDGQDYAARWMARRARDRIDGRLQAVARSLWRLADGQVLASQSTHVAQEVERLAGLSWDEFRRTVLLAQGDFDAFLRADTSARAALLEKITGTALYRAVSIRIYERMQEAAAAHRELTGQRALLPVLAEADLAALEAEAGRLAADSEAAARQRATLAAGIEAHDRLARAAAQLEAASAAEDGVLAAREAAGAERDLLARIDAVAPLRLPFGRHRDAQARLRSAAAAVARSAEERETAQAAQRASDTAARRADSLHETSEAEFKSFGPVWDEAAALDARLHDAAREAAAAGEAAQAAQATARQAEATRTDLAEQVAAVRTAADLATARLDGLARRAPLADRRDEIDRDLADREAARATLSGALAGAGQEGAVARDLEARIAALDAADHDDRAAQAEGDTKTARIAAAIAVIEETAPQSRAGRLADLWVAIEAAARAAADHAAAGKLAAQARDTAAAAGEAARRAESEGQAARRALARAEAAAEALSAPLQRADLALGAAARQLRMALAAGAPCPVCGATEHRIHADAELRELAETLRADRDSARREAAEAQAAVAAAGQASAAAGRDLAHAGQDAAAAAVRARTARTDWASAIGAARRTPECPDLPDDPAHAEPALAAAMPRIRAARDEVAAQLDELARLRADLDAAAARRQWLAGQIEARRGQRAAAEDRRQAAAQAAALARQAAQAATARITEIDRRLAPALAALGAPPDAADTDPAGLRARLGAAAQEVADARAGREGAEAALAALAPRLGAAGAQAEAAAARAAETLAIARERQRVHEDLTRRRKALLGGEETETHRSRMNAARLAAQRARDAARRNLACAASNLAGALSAEAAATTERQRAEQAVAEAAAILGDALRGSGTDETGLAALLDRTPDEIRALRQRLGALDDAVTAATAARAARQADRDAAAGNVPADPPEILAALLDDLDRGERNRQHRLGAIAGQRAADALRRRDLAELDARIAAAAAEHEVWQAVSAAAGSRNGDRFARVAQSITLDLLVDNANHHLAELKPRYRLRRGNELSLQVEDLDMGAEPRATRSLSGGERFLVSLALALALSRMSGKSGLAATLFIDEGFGSLDAESLDMAIDALERLQSQGRSVGVISHVEAMKDRIPVQIRILRQGGGRSRVEVAAP